MVREVLFALILVCAAACVVVGVSHWSLGAAWCAAGVLSAGIGWLVLGGDPGATGGVESAGDES